MAQLKSLCFLGLLASLMFTPAKAAEPFNPNSAALELLRSLGADFCQQDTNVQDVCTTMLEAYLTTGTTQDVVDILKDDLKTELRKPEFLNSALADVFDGKPPLGLAFKSLDAEEGESVLGLTYDFSYSLKRTDNVKGKSFERIFKIDFVANGTITQNSEENPRNFLETKFSFNTDWYTKIPQKDRAFGGKLSQLTMKLAQCSDNNPDSQECIDLDNQASEMMEEALGHLKSFQRYEVGIEAGYESDQRFDATQSVISAYGFAQFESWDKTSTLGSLGITPAVLISFDSVDPNQETPRALAGDSSEYYRASAEVSLWMPLGSVFDSSMILTYNYRHYRELSPSDVVKDAGLDSYNLSTFGLRGTNGLFVTYSTGQLPFNFDKDRVVELGWMTYF